MEERDTVLEKMLEYVQPFKKEFEEYGVGNVWTMKSAYAHGIISLQNERNTIERLMTKLTTSGAKFTLSTEIDRIDQLIEKLKTL